MTARLYTNPVFVTDFADVGILKRPEGYYACASQGDADGVMHNIQMAFSRDLVRWERLPDALPQKASWAAEQDYWAPDIVELGPRDYRLFFNAKVNGSGQGIGVAAATQPQGPFTVKGDPLVHGEKYVHIDAKFFKNPLDGHCWLLWGSCYEPIRIKELRDDLLGFRDPDEPAIGLLRPDPDDPTTRLYEAAWMTARQDENGKTWFYLYTSGPDAFGDESYAVHVARSEKGPASGFVTRREATGSPDSIIYRSNEKFLNPGASAITTDDAGREWLVSHATLRSDVPDYAGLRRDPDKLWQKLRYTRRVLIIDPIEYAEGWPFVRGGTPSSEPRPAPLLKEAVRQI
jgi:arabinan endo-1,5-alpha-L-arabinosidase